MTAHWYLFCPCCAERSGKHRRTHHVRRVRSGMERFRCKACNHVQTYVLRGSK
jgi:hypothetical protein